MLENGYVERVVYGPDGLIYHGNKKNGVAEGYGECLYLTKDHIRTYLKVGNWRDDYLEGKGIQAGSDNVNRTTFVKGEWQTKNWHLYYYKHNNSYSDKEAMALWLKYYPYIVFGHLTNFRGNLDGMKNKGKAMALTSKLPSEFVELSDVQWSGEVRDGKIQGNGMGFVCIPGEKQDEYIYIQGVFEDGIMQVGYFKSGLPKYRLPERVTAHLADIAMNKYDVKVGP